MNAADVMATTVATLVDAIEAGAGEWRMPWHHTGTIGMPVNVSTGQPYSGGNVLALWGAAFAHGWPTQQWATYKQWASLGAQVRKGETGTGAIYWKVKPAETITEVDAETGEEVELTSAARVQWARSFTLFNAAQVDGWTTTHTTGEVEAGPLADWFANIPARVLWGMGDPCYRPAADVVVMPAPDAFRHDESRWATLAHELAHWTGHPARLNRVFGKRFGDDAYAAEELVAELSSAFTCATLGIPTEARTDHAAYLASWCRVLKADPGILWSVAGKASAATNHLASYQPATVGEQAA